MIHKITYHTITEYQSNHLRKSAKPISENLRECLPSKALLSGFFKKRFNGFKT